MNPTRQNIIEDLQNRIWKQRITTLDDLKLEISCAEYEGEPVYEEEAPITDWWCVIETEEEDMVYRDFEQHLGEYTDSRQVLWNKMMIHAGQPQGLSWGDDDVYGYLSPDEDVPEVGEEMVDGDGDVWERIG